MNDHYTRKTRYRELDFLGHPGYRVGTDGSVWSKWEMHGYGAPKYGFYTELGTKWKKLKPSPEKNGYLMVSLKSKSYKVHTLVLTAFVGPRPARRVACHYPNQDKTDNRLCNLFWGTSRENALHTKENGTYVGGEKNPAAILTTLKVAEIRQLYSTGKYSYTSLARMYDVSRGTIAHIITKRTWREDMFKINWPNPTKEPMDIRDLLQMNRKMIQELHDRWTNPSWCWGSFTFDPNAVLEEIELYLKEGQTSNWKRGREFI